MSGPTWKRPKTPAPIDRDVYTEKHDAAPEEIWDEPGTGTVSGDDLRRIRNKRPTDKRLEKLEEFKDAALVRMGEIHGDVREMRGELRAFITAQTENGKTKRLSISTDGKVIIAVTGTIAAIAIAAIKVLG